MRMRADELAVLARRLFGAYADGDLDGFRGLLADDLTAYVTNAAAGVDELHGVDDYMRRVPDLHAAGGELSVTQILPIDDERVLAMVEIKAERDGRRLHNFAAFLAQVRDGKVKTLWMVDALPAYSDEFWS
jgi:ketosteroid isomerase-like protein